MNGCEATQLMRSDDIDNMAHIHTKDTFFSGLIIQNKNLLKRVCRGSIFSQRVRWQHKAGERKSI